MKNIKLMFLGLFAIVFIVSCSTKTDDELFNEAKQKIKDKEYVEAITDLEKIVNNHPNGKLTPKAMFELAQLYHGKVVKDIPEKQSLQTAVEYYKKVFEKIPKTTEGERSLFMAAFLEANELKKYDEARELYNKFLKVYPQSELVPSAKEEIANLGIPPEDILKKKVSVKK